MQKNSNKSIILKNQLSDTILYIYNSEYLFCNDKLKLVSFNQYLRDHLIDMDYSSVLFFDNKMGSHVLKADHVSLSNLHTIESQIFQLNNPNDTKSSNAQSANESQINFPTRGLVSRSTVKDTSQNSQSGRNYQDGIKVFELSLVMDELDKFINRKNDPAIANHRLAIVLDGDALLTLSSGSTLSAQENKILTYLDKWNDKNYVRNKTTIFILFNGLDTESNIVTKISTYYDSPVARGRLSKLPPLHSILRDYQHAYENLHRNIINVPNLPSRNELLNYLHHLKITKKIEYDPFDLDGIVDVLFYYSRPHSYYDNDKREQVEDNHSYSLHNIHQRFSNWLEKQSTPVFITPEILTSTKKDNNKSSVFDVTIAKSAETQMANDIIGLDDIKQRIKDLKKLMLRKKNDQIESNPRHSSRLMIDFNQESPGKGTKGELSFLFLGNPGTGKTTIGNIMGQLLKDAGYITSGHLVKENAAKLKGSTVGSTIAALSNLTEKANGGVLFIDEIATISSRDENKSVISEFNSGILAATDETDNLVTVLAGYPKETEAYLQTDPGLRGRFNSENTFYFNDYSGEEMAQLFKKMVERTKDKDFKFMLHESIEPSKSNKLLSGIMSQWYKVYHERGLQGWANVRFIRDLVKTITNQMILNQQGYILNLDHLNIEFQGIHFAELIKMTKNQPLIGIDMLNSLVGLSQVKKEIESLKSQADLNFPIPRFYILIGNPGTGKKTTARLLSELFSDWKITNEKKATFIEYQHLTSTNDFGSLFQGKDQKTIITTGFESIFDKDSTMFLGSNQLKALFSDLDQFRGYYIFTLSPHQEQAFKIHFERLWYTSKVLRLEDFNDEQLSELLIRKIKSNDFSFDETLTGKLSSAISEFRKLNLGLSNTDLVDNLFYRLGASFSQRSTIASLENQNQMIDKRITSEDILKIERGT